MTNRIVTEIFEHQDKVQLMRQLRTQLSSLFREWDPNIPDGYTHATIAKFIGFKDNVDFIFYIAKWSDNHAEVLKKMQLLAGPHGYTVYRMMKAKKNRLQE